MDSALRRRFLTSLKVDFAALELSEKGVRRWMSGRADWPINGPTSWAGERAWWLRNDPSPVVSSLSAADRDFIRDTMATLDASF